MALAKPWAYPPYIVPPFGLNDAYNDDIIISQTETRHARGGYKTKQMAAFNSPADKLPVEQYHPMDAVTEKDHISYHGLTDTYVRGLHRPTATPKSKTDTASPTSALSPTETDTASPISQTVIQATSASSKPFPSLLKLTRTPLVDIVPTSRRISHTTCAALLPREMQPISAHASVSAHERQQLGVVISFCSVLLVLAFCVFLFNRRRSTGKPGIVVSDHDEDIEFAHVGLK